MPKRDRTIKKKFEKTFVEPHLIELRAQQREQFELERKELARLVERLFENVRFVRARLGELPSGRRIDEEALRLLRSAIATLAEVYRRLF
jgi:hypothetical protein